MYYLNKTGREVIGSEDEVKWTLQAEHHLLRNDLYLHYGCPAEWKPEREIHFSIKNGMMMKDMKIVPDVFFTINGRIHLAEVDRTQSMAENKKKIENYQLIAPYMHHQFGHVPVIVFYTVTEMRRDKLKALCREAGVMCEVYTKEDLR